MTRQIVLIGAGQTSVSAARTLRQYEFDGDVVIVGDEPHLPYQRPPLSKEYLQGKSDDDDIWSAPPDWYSENNVKLELGARALRIDRATLDVELDNGKVLGADAVLIATGGSPRRFPSAEGDSILYLHSLEDARRLRAETRAGRHIIIVGGGFIGAETAASARILGADVTMIEAMNAPLQHALGEEIGGVCGAIHTENGVDVRCGVSVVAIEDSASGVTVTTSDGEKVKGDVVIVGVGINPNVDVARATEITVGNGIRVDEFCRTSAEGIYAAGDVANHYHPLFDRRLRVEHFDNANRQGAVAALNMMGVRTGYDDPHWFWSDQYCHSFQYVGHADCWDDIVIRGSIEDRDFLAFYMVDGKIVAALGLNRGGDILVVKSLLSSDIGISAEILKDENVGLEEMQRDNLAESEGVSGIDMATSDNGGDYKRAARSGQVPEGKVRRFVVDGVEIAIARLDGKVYAIHNLCTHMGCHLASGRVEHNGLTCLCHGSVFNLRTGEPINPPATKAVKTYPVRETNEQIYVSVK